MPRKRRADKENEVLKTDLPYTLPERMHSANECNQPSHRTHFRDMGQRVGGSLLGAVMLRKTVILRDICYIFKNH